MAALLAPLLSIATFSGTPLAFMAFSKNRRTAANRALVLAEHFLKQGHKPDRPAVDGGMIDTNAKLLHHFFQVAVAERLRCVPADAHQNPSQLGIAFL